MDIEDLWRLFWRTGLPEAYSLLGLLREEKETAREDNKSA